jgi:hypothetical protein
MELNDALHAWLDANEAETKANEARIAAEGHITKHLNAKSEGAVTHALDGFKVTLTQPITRKLDERAWTLVMDGCPKELRPVKTKLEADTAGMKWLADNEPAIWRKIAQAFEIKPGKIGVKVEVVANGD